MARRMAKQRKRFENKQYFPNIIERLKMEINLTTELIIMLTGHGKLKAYYLDLK